MKATISLLATGLLLFSGCVDFDPFISKSDLGNLEINIAAPEGLDPQASRIYVDNIFIGNVSPRKPIVYLKTGKHVIRVELEGATTYTQGLTILGDPNHQVLNIPMQRKSGT